MVMNDGSIFAVKRINRSCEGSDKIFERELEILGSIKHISLVNLCGYCSLPTVKLLKLPTVYKMVVNDGSVFAVKRINRSREGSDKIFERELEILGSIKHINLVNLRGYCRLPTVKLLMCDYVTLGSLDHFLHGKKSNL
ncbi:PREDICTED: LRR receptor-like serine/threonine-protein kinase FEI 1 [Nelumbo nucifera]|uniref:Protein kinase domain-containing protein n=2 Tax=Nelumbo nucifera TaxID=4432 RepID=A0A822YJ63_NELNU|nr:PREDICTED: LRR receptor-like serine/threonine-protein kinase FEI 1 [Nelumbo nucifera]DAD32532.1 TPA_asm: hypothetical protein HUJ06_011383 [Nelumbo nucifera]